MNNIEYNNCIKILNKEPGWFGREENINSKLECLETFRSKGSPSNIHVLIPFLKNESELFRQRTADVIVSLFDKLKSQNQLYESLKYLRIDVSDIDYFKKTFPRDISVKLLALSSVNHNGYVRQRAIEALALANHPLAIRFLIIRLSDWVKNVREAAAQSIRRYFKNSYRGEFINVLEQVEGLKNVSRVDLSNEFTAILDYIFEKQVTVETFESLAVSDKARRLYFNRYIERNGIDPELVEVLIEDRNFLVRIQVLKHLKKVNELEQQKIILQLLNDKSSQVRLQTLYSLMSNSDKYYDSVLMLTSDLSSLS
jgi:HEAT repeat protein